MSPIRIAVVGLGKIARDRHLAAIRNNDSLSLVATVSLDGAGLEDTAHFESLDALQAGGPPFDAIVLCTPPQVRFALASQAILAGKHVFLEKPPGATLSEVFALEQLALASRVSLLASWHSRFAGGVEPARNWLSQRRITHAEVIWREDVRIWHPGQAWIWQPGGLGVFDPGINALSIMTSIIPGPLRLVEAQLQVPENRAMPIAADLRLEGPAGVKVSVDLDFRQRGQQNWDIIIHTDDGLLQLTAGGSDLSLPSGRQQYVDGEYEALYAHFAILVRAGESDVDAAPLRLVADAFLLGERRIVEPFHEA